MSILQDLETALDMAVKPVLGENARCLTDPLAWLDTDITLVNCTLHRNAYGVPSGRGLHFYGPPTTGKTLLAYMIAKKCQELGGLVVLLNTERFAVDLARLVGLDYTKQFVLYHPPTLEKLQATWEAVAMALLNSPVPIVLITDSIAGKDALSNQNKTVDTQTYQQGLAAQLWSRFFKRIAYAKVEHSNIFCIFTNQVRLKLEFWKKGNFAPTEVPTGGFPVAHAMDLELGCAASKLYYSGTSGSKDWADAKDKTIVGTWLMMKATKNRFGPTHRPIGIPIYSQWGVDDVLANLDWLTTSIGPNLGTHGGELFARAGSVYKLNGGKGKPYATWHQLALEDAVLAKEIRDVTVARYTSLYHDWDEVRR